MLYTVYMDAKNIQKITGVSRAIIYKNDLHEMDNETLESWLRGKLVAVESQLENLENARSGYVALLSILESV